jgi:hypothetical protein
MTRIVRNSLFTVLATLSVAGAARAGGEPPAAPPPEVKQLLGQMQGTWTAKEVTVQVEGKPCKGTSKVTCDKAANGWALTCRVHADMGPVKIDEVDIVGWDSGTNSLHVFSVSSDAVAHDHKGTFANNVFATEYAATNDGKPFHESLSFIFKNPRELTWKDVVTLGGQAIFSGEGVYKK